MSGRVNPGPRRWVKLDPARVKSLYLEGLSIRDVGKALGVHPTTVLDALKQLGVTRRPVGCGRRVS